MQKKMLFAFNNDRKSQFLSDEPEIVQKVIEQHRFLERLRSELLNNPTPITATNIHNIDGNYICTIQKKDAIDCLLLLTMVNNNKMSIIITHTTWFFVKFRFESSIFKNITCFRTQLVKDPRSNLWILFVDDVLYNKNGIHSLNLLKRLDHCNQILKYKFKFDCAISVCDIRLTGYFTYNHFGLLEKNTNVILRNITDKSAFFIEYQLEQKHFFHGQVKQLYVNKLNKPDVFAVEEDTRMGRVDRGLLGITSIVMSQKVKLLVESRTPSEQQQPLECIYDSIFQSWFIKSFYNNT